MAENPYESPTEKALKPLTRRDHIIAAVSMSFVGMAALAFLVGGCFIGLMVWQPSLWRFSLACGGISFTASVAAAIFARNMNKPFRNSRNWIGVMLLLLCVVAIVLVESFLV